MGFDVGFHGDFTINIVGILCDWIGFTSAIHHQPEWGYHGYVIWYPGDMIWCMGSTLIVGYHSSLAPNHQLSCFDCCYGCYYDVVVVAMAVVVVVVAVVAVVAAVAAAACAGGGGGWLLVVGCWLWLWFFLFLFLFMLLDFPHQLCIPYLIMWL